jgi:hypothetical protein
MKSDDQCDCILAIQGYIVCMCSRGYEQTLVSYSRGLAASLKHYFNHNCINLQPRAMFKVCTC